MEQIAGEERARAFGEPGGLEVLVLEVPGVADGGVAHADVQLIRSGEHSLGHGIGAGDDQLVPGEIELLDRQRHERQIVPVPIPGSGKPLDERGSRSAAPQEVALLPGDKVDQAEEIRVRVQNE
jgi:hypothetical protein